MRKKFDREETIDEEDSKNGDGEFIWKDVMVNCGIFFEKKEEKNGDDDYKGERGDEIFGDVFHNIMIFIYYL